MARQGWGRHSTVATGSDSGDQVSVNAWNADINKAGMLGFTGETIASATSITPTNSTIILSGSTNVSTIAQGNSAEYDLLYVFTSGSVTLVNTASPSSAGDIKLLANANKDLSSTVPTILIRKGTAWYEYGGGITNSLDDIGDVVITSVANEDVLAYDSVTSKWINQSADETGRVTADSTTTFTNKSIDQDGTGNSITNIADASIKAAAAIDATKIADGSVTSTEFQYINTLSSNAQTQLDAKSPSAGSSSIVTTGALNSGSITSGFGNINIGSSTFTTTGAVATGAITAGGTITGDVTGDLTGNVTGNVTGDLTGNVTGNASGTAATVTGAAQTNITSVGTLTSLSVDNLTIDTNKIEATNTNGNIQLDSNGTGVIEVLGNTNDGAITLNCTSNSHGQTIKSQPHSAAVTNTMLLPQGASSTLVSLVSADTLTNKTLTAPVINVGSDADGDVYYRASGVFTRLPKGTAGQVLTINSGATAPEWATSSGGASTLLDFKYQATGYTTPSYTTRTVNDASTPIQLWVKDIDTNNQGIYIRIKKNAAYTDVQIA
jgi:hypothetical protein